MMIFMAALLEDDDLAGGAGRDDERRVDGKFAGPKGMRLTQLELRGFEQTVASQATGGGEVVGDLGGGCVGVVDFGGLHRLIVLRRDVPCNKDRV